MVTAGAASAATHDGVTTPITANTAPVTAVTAPITADTAPARRTDVGTPERRLLRVPHHRSLASEAATRQAWRVVGGAGRCRPLLLRQPPGGLLSPSHTSWRRSLQLGYLLLPGSGAFGLETFWFGSATSESLRDSDDDGATTEVGLAASEPNEARGRAQREGGTSACERNDTGRRVERAVRRG